jgi:putative nucleotidyltransferase with HDIG domain
VRNLVVSAEVFSKWPSTTGPHSLQLDTLQHHASQVAAVAYALVHDTPIANDTLLAALLHDIGYWVLLKERAPQLTEAIRMAATESITMDEAEQRLFGASHAEIGAYLLGIWGFPSTIVEAVAHHHSPSNVAQTGFDALAALSIAHALTEPNEGAAFGEADVRHSEITADYLAAVRAPFSWDEAKAKAIACLESGGPSS